MNQTEKNRALIRTYVDAMNSHNIDAATALVTEGLVNHAAIPEAQGRAGFRRIAEKMNKAFPDGAFRVEDVIAENDRVVARMVFTGTQTGDIEFTRFPVKATGRRVEVDHVHVFRIEGDKVAEHWACRDDVGLMRQLGVLKEPS
jgi:steroid delta-isomerase-like uncharacterized protein